MKKFWEKHSLGKTLTIILVLSFLLTWIIPVGSFNGTEFVKGDVVRIGLADIGNLLYYVIAIGMDKIMFLLVLGIFYAILSKSPAYQKLVTNIANKMKGKEILFATIVSFLIALFTAFASNTFAVLVFIPFVVSILSKMKLDKVTITAVGFGSILVGVLGCIFGTEGLFSFNTYLSSATLTNFIKDGWVTRMIVFIAAFALFTIFNVLHMKKALKDKKAEGLEDPYVAEEDDKSAKKAKNVRVWPTVVVLVLVALFTIIGFINWFDNFGIEVFNNFHNWLIGLSINDNAIISYIIGSSAVPLGNSNFSLFTLISVLIVFGFVIMCMTGFKFDDLITSIKTGVTKSSKVVLPLIAIYTVFAIFYLSPMMNSLTSGLIKVDGHPNINIDYKGSGKAYFNVDTDKDGKADKNLVSTSKDCKVNCDTNNDGYPDKNLDFDGNGKVDDNDLVIAASFSGESVLNLDTDGDGTPDINVDTDISVPGTILTGFISSIFHPDFNYTAYSLSYRSSKPVQGFLYFVAGFAANLSIIFIIMITMFGFSSLFLPTSALLAIGLAYTDLEYGKWLKYIWRFLACAFVFLVILFIVLGAI